MEVAHNVVKFLQLHWEIL